MQLQLSRDDVDGTVEVTGAGQRLVLFDSVPGGAGGVTAIAESLPMVLERALKRVSQCECGIETSCYACLRGFRNQRYHDLLSRGAAGHLLAELLGVAQAAEAQ